MLSLYFAVVTFCLIVEHIASIRQAGTFGFEYLWQKHTLFIPWGIIWHSLWRKARGASWLPQTWYLWVSWDTVYVTIDYFLSKFIYQFGILWTTTSGNNLIRFLSGPVYRPAATYVRASYFTMLLAIMIIILSIWVKPWFFFKLLWNLDFVYFVPYCDSDKRKSFFSINGMLWTSSCILLHTAVWIYDCIPENSYLKH